MKMESGSKILNRYSFSSQASISKINKLLDVLSKKALCRDEISKEIHVNYRHAKNYINHLLAEKKIYVSEWKLENQGERTMFWPYYRTGNRKSKPRPANLSPSERCKRYRKKLETDDIRKDRLNKKRRLKRLIIKPDWTASWMMESNTTQTSVGGV
jgi:hypothetical protein